MFRNYIEHFDKFSTDSFTFIINISTQVANYNYYIIVSLFKESIQSLIQEISV